MPDFSFFPCLGVVLSNLLYFAPMPAVLRANRQGSLGSLNVLPQALMVCSTVAWISYALSVPNMYILVSNLPGAVAAFAYVALLLPLIPRDARDDRVAVQAVLIGGAAAMLLVWSALVAGEFAAKDRSFWLGAYGSAICIVLFASPLSTAQRVVASGDASSIYLPLTAAQVCITWHAIVGMA